VAAPPGAQGRRSICRLASRLLGKARCVSTESASRDGRPRRRSQSMRAPTARRSSVASLASPSNPTRTTSAPTSGTRVSEGGDRAAKGPRVPTRPHLTSSYRGTIGSPTRCGRRWRQCSATGCDSK
jgi:hypothetical protein